MMTGTSTDATTSSPSPSPPLPASSAEPQAAASAPVLLCLQPASGETISALLAGLPSAFPEGSVVVAGAEAFDGDTAGIPLISYTSPRSNLGWVLAAGDYSAAAATLSAGTYTGAIVVATEAFAARPDLLAAFAASLREGADVVLPRFSTGAHDALVTAALLYPITRALFGGQARFPLPVAAALSPRMLQRLAPSAQRIGAEGLLWPVSEAAVAGFLVREIDVGMHTPPPPPDADLNQLLTGVASSLFLDVEAKATFWQRMRQVTSAADPAMSLPSGGSEAASEVAEIVDSFRLAYANLLEIWSLVLPPQTLVALKRLSQASPSNFVLQPELWARIVYEFALAFHLRSLNRGHLLGALTPLYLAWVASHVRAVGDDAELAAQLVSITAAAFEREKPYLVSRWRWPDRFNP